MKKQILKFFFVFWLLLIFSYCFASDYVVTNILKVNTADETRVRVIFNNFLVIENIKVFHDKSIEMPFYENKQGKKYLQVEIIDPELEQILLDSIENYISTQIFVIQKPKFEIKNITPIKNSKRRANVELVIDNKILIICGVMETRSGTWVAWPASKKFDEKYHKDVYILNSKLEEQIEKDILEEYKEIISV